MIVFQKLGWHGRLGNCMFQFAAMKSLAKHLNIKAKIPIDLKYRVNLMKKMKSSIFIYSTNITYVQKEVEVILQIF